MRYVQGFNSFVRKCKSESDLLESFNNAYYPFDVPFHASDVILNKTLHEDVSYKFRDWELLPSSSNDSLESSLYDYLPDPVPYFLESNQEAIVFNSSYNNLSENAAFQFNYCQSNFKEFDQYGKGPNFDTSEIDKSLTEEDRKCGKHVASTPFLKSDRFDTFYFATGALVGWKLLPLNIFIFVLMFFIIIAFGYFWYKKLSGEGFKTKLF